MISRRKILSRSRDDISDYKDCVAYEEEEDVWYEKEKLYKQSLGIWLKDKHLFLIFRANCFLKTSEFGEFK
ncbi:hypothetical protein B4U80_07350 [Leptotrombidium deliense]|uniref:Uncharacterized protein n=1 Tax=Leptotrombidium deliense TaxID=299467 RepID=A0A443SH00_9ACAR|nr:hypothetical protein B4U80_07350 [Leptotrombidium deliense]